MTDLITAAQMRSLEAEAIASGRVTGWSLMERAGRGAAGIIRRRFSIGPRRAVVLAGPGNNGGDGLVIATALSEAGWGMEVFTLGPPCRAEAVQAARDCPLTPRPMAALTESVLAGHPVVIDAMFGTGLTRPIDDGVWGALTMAEDAGCPVVAIDILSGIDADSGRLLGAGTLERPAALTITFECWRTGHALDQGAALSGPVEVVPIGLQPELQALLRRDGDGVAELCGPPDLTKQGGHKYDHGHAVVVAGPAGHGGAARMAARAALRIGAGLVTLAASADAMAENAARLDAIMLRDAGEPQALSTLLQDRRINAVLLGPGLGRSRAAGLVAAAAGRDVGLVLDADALTADLPSLPGRCVLTPHAGEFARLVPDIAERLAAEPTRGPAFSRIDAAREAAARLKAVVLLKGPDTVIAHPSGRVAVNLATGARAVPWLATAGAGDVLAGMIAGLLARGLQPFEAARAAAWLHVEAARRFGPGLIAEDLPEALPGALGSLPL